MAHSKNIYFQSIISMPILKFNSKITTLLIVCISLQLTGCKVAAEIGESLFKVLGKLTAKVIENSVLDSDKNTANSAIQDNDLPFILLDGETYKKIKDDHFEYYEVKRLGGITEHYALDGELLWSDAESDYEESSSDELLGIDFSNTEAIEEKMEVRTEIQHNPNPFNATGYSETHYLIITSYSNQPIEILNVYLNRGYCKGSWQFSNNSTLKHYSATTKILLNTCKTDTLKEVEIKTTNNTYTYEF